MLVVGILIGVAGTLMALGIAAWIGGWAGSGLLMAVASNLGWMAYVSYLESTIETMKAGKAMEDT